MTIDTSALRKFQEVWGPVLQAIPAVLDAAEREAELERSIQLKRNEFAKVEKDIEDAYAKADARLETLNAELSSVTERRRTVQKEIDDAREQGRKDAAEAEKQKQELLAGLQAAIDIHKAQLQGLEQEYATKKKEAEAAHGLVVKALNDEIDELNKRKATAEQALRDLKAKLG